jgi:hypothetical protein
MLTIKIMCEILLRFAKFNKHFSFSTLVPVLLLLRSELLQLIIDRRIVVLARALVLPHLCLQQLQAAPDLVRLASQRPQLLPRARLRLSIARVLLLHLARQPLVRLTQTVVALRGRLQLQLGGLFEACQMQPAGVEVVIEGLVVLLVDLEVGFDLKDVGIDEVDRGLALRAPRGQFLPRSKVRLLA